MTNASLLATGMTDAERATLLVEMSAIEKDEVAGVLLALLLGAFGAHHFYLRRNALGVLYLLFFWTGIPAVAGLVECFLMPGRVRRFNFEQASMLAAAIRGVPLGSIAPPASIHAPVLQCASCGNLLVPGVRFCARCGAAV